MARWRAMGAVAAAAVLAVPAASQATTFKTLAVPNEQVGLTANFGMARTANGSLRLIFPTRPTPTASADGLGTLVIKAGAPGPFSTVLSGYNPNHPALIGQAGVFDVFFGGNSPDNLTSIFEITSTDDGATWSTPQDALNHDSDNSQSYAADVAAAFDGATKPVLALPHNDMVVQQGIGPNAPTSVVTNSSDNAVLDTDLATDSASGAVVAGWISGAGNGGNWLQQIAPTAGAAQSVPGPVEKQLIPAARSVGGGVFAAYSTDNKHVRLVRYGGGSVSVGSASGVTPTRLAAATGPGGRIWVMWGTEGQAIAVTRSNKAVTKFEPIQKLPLNADGLARLSGNGQEGPLDLFADGIPHGKGIGATMYAYVKAILSATASVKKSTLTVKVTDAGDAVAGATVKAGGKTASTNSKGVATLTLKKPAKSATVSAPGYQTLKIKL